MPLYRVASPAIRDLDQIWVYYDSVANEEVANRLLDRLYRTFLLLAQQPHIGKARPELASGLRSYAVPNTRFLIFHAPREYGVEVVRLVHGSRDLRLLFQ